MFCSGDDFVQATRIAAELDAAMLRVGTGNVQLVCSYAFAFVKNLNGMLVVFAGVSEDIGDDHDVFDLAQLGKFFVDESAGANVLEADGVQHPGRSLI